MAVAPSFYRLARADEARDPVTLQQALNGPILFLSLETVAVRAAARFLPRKNRDAGPACGRAWLDDGCRSSSWAVCSCLR